MSRYNPETLYNLLPAVYRRRDAEEGYPLRDLVTILAEQAEIVEHDIDRLYENQFVETADPWVLPYIGDLIGIEPIHETPQGRRAEIANTIGYRRRKGTAAVLEQIARDVTGWPARVVEYFELLSWTQFMNHVRLHSPRNPDLRNSTAMAHVDQAFDQTAHTANIRPIRKRRGRHNIMNVGLWVWRIAAWPSEISEPAEANVAEGRYYFNPLAADIPMFHTPVSEIGPSHIAEETNVPAPIRLRALDRDLMETRGEYFGPDRSVSVMVPSGDRWVLLNENYVACDLGEWMRPIPANTVAIDTKRGRLRFANPAAVPEFFRVIWHYGFSAALGGGQYQRADSIGDDSPTHIVGHPDDPLVMQAQLDLPEAAFFPNVEDALQDAQAGWLEGEARIVEIVDNSIYPDALSAITIPANARITVRAANRRRPVLNLPQALAVTGGDGSALILDGLTVNGSGLEVSGDLNRLEVRHCTFTPGLSLDEDGTPASPGAVSLTIESNETEESIEHSILGALHAAPRATVTIRDSILDSHDFESQTFGAPAGGPFGGVLLIYRSTVIGTIRTTELRHGENTLFLGIVTAERKQEGCVRFSWVPLGSRVPYRYQCHPEVPTGTSPQEAQRIQARSAPRFVSLQYGRPEYAQLDWRGPEVILRGADDESEMGVYSSLQQTQREENLRIRLQEYLPAGLEAGVVFAS